MSVGLVLHLVRRSSALGWLQVQATNVFFLVERTLTCWADISTAFQQYPVVDRGGVRSSVQVAVLGKYGVLSSMKRWVWEKMKVWTMG